jgi:transcription elongation factor Elf1
MGGYINDEAAPWFEGGDLEDDEWHSCGRTFRYTGGIRIYCSECEEELTDENQCPACGHSSTNSYFLRRCARCGGEICMFCGRRFSLSRAEMLVRSDACFNEMLEIRHNAIGATTRR